MNDVEVRIEKTAGRITLNRPKTLNALTHGMVIAIRRALDAWRDDARVTRVIIDGAGDRAFCSGGDVRYLYEHGRYDPESCRKLLRDEYQLNAVIAHYPKPYVPIMGGIVMGGGIGLSAHGSHRIVTDNSLMAMPEVSIGFLPDVGSTLLLARAPGALGLYLGLAAARIGAADALWAGFADSFVPHNALPDLIDVLVDGEAVDTAIDRFAKDAGPSLLAARQGEIDEIFNVESVDEILVRLQGAADNGHVGEEMKVFASSALAAIKRSSPLSLACAYTAICRARTFESIEEALTLEYRFTWRCLDRTDVYEGIRAAVISRHTPPAWDPATLSAVSRTLVESMLSPLGTYELRFRRDGHG